MLCYNCNAKDGYIMRILIAEDEKALSKVLVKIFEKNNYSVDSVNNGATAIDYIKAGNYDVVVLDVMMPKADGITVLRTIRESGNQVPVLILSAKYEIEDKVMGLDSGANYYLTKPFDTKELLATIRAITRTQVSADTKISFGNVTLDRATFELSSSTGSFRLANKEFQMLEMFMTNPRYVISAEKFMEKIWGYDTEAEINVVWVYVSYLRKKLTALNADVQIKALRNVGYLLEEAND